MGIDIPQVLLHLRARAVREQAPAAEKAVFGAAAWAFGAPRRFAAAQKAGRAAELPLVRGGLVRRLPGPLAGWTEGRDLRPVARETFREWWARERGAARAEAAASNSRRRKAAEGGPSSGAAEQHRSLAIERGAGDAPLRDVVASFAERLALAARGGPPRGRGRRRGGGRRGLRRAGVRRLGVPPALPGRLAPGRRGRGRGPRPLAGRARRPGRRAHRLHARDRRDGVARARRRPCRRAASPLARPGRLSLRRPRGPGRAGPGGGDAAHRRRSSATPAGPWSSSPARPPRPTSSCSAWRACTARGSSSSCSAAQAPATAAVRRRQDNADRFAPLWHGYPRTPASARPGPAAKTSPALHDKGATWQYR